MRRRGYFLARQAFPPPPNPQICMSGKEAAVSLHKYNPPLPFSQTICMILPRFSHGESLSLILEWAETRVHARRKLEKDPKTISRTYVYAEKRQKKFHFLFLLRCTVVYRAVGKRERSFSVSPLCESRVSERWKKKVCLACKSGAISFYSSFAAHLSRQWDIVLGGGREWGKAQWVKRKRESDGCCRKSRKGEGRDQCSWPRELR